MADLTLKNKTALITGASGAIGGAIANKLSSLGANVILTDKIKEKIDDLEKKLGPNSLGLIADLSKDEEIDNLYNESIKKFKSIDILVNNAGIARWGSIEEVTYEDFDEQVKFNLTGTFNTIKEITPMMIKQKSGNIVNIITSTVKKTKSGRVAYAASKYGQAGLSNAVHEDLKEKGISVVAVYPGKTNTPIHDNYIKQDDPVRNEMLKPEEVAEVVLEAALIPTEDDVKELIVN